MSQIEESRLKLVSALRLFGARQDWPTFEDALSDAIGRLVALSNTKRKLHDILRTRNHESIVQRAEDVMARIAALEAALAESIKLQSHYARLLNLYDGGARLEFVDADAWLRRLAALRAAEQEEA